ncbi:hypothetical protein BGW36DRAFT_456623 [Talaromyces proteolyticus]|uniref:tRNA(Ile)-lysidine synthetase n=1 Tax=Talaromyces proteolyticus TaxID=1131652 RepID=A0AAD4L060_9EURO|nr:uncharacterized protein BGW36DRAFT_456623 [Talaromyces proteolyticus]KAH8705107.1 hypothetical protein BGW36DRAFT_456623 [Talaromyces proteolyticus]
MASLLKQKQFRPIAIQQFFQSLDHAWRSSPQYIRPRHLPRRIGIAVSGGADSMALAGLCRQLQLDQPELFLYLKAFIIDHKARKESSEEAQTVAEWLSKLGIETEILPLVWPSGKDVTEVTAFETSARQKRYLALGEACRTNNLTALLTGHHLNDNVETAILRLCQRSGREGLTGIAPLSRIPEGYGVWGISDSGSFQKIEGDQQRFLHACDARSRQPTCDGQVNQKEKSPRKSVTFNMATGGILLCRPLLPFTKSSILDTCSELGIPFVTDPTNFDTALTVRNTIRSLLSNNKLPRALQSSSMSAFLSRNRNSSQNLMLQTDSLLRECRLFEFIAGSSTMNIQLPLLDNSHPLMSYGNNPRLLAASLRRITELVSPLDDKSHALHTYAGFASRIFTGQQIEDFTVGGAQYRLSIKDGAECSVWHVSRAPFRAHFSPELNITDLTEQFSSPVLWDSRYWLQFRLTPETKRTGFSGVVVRSLGAEDIKQVFDIRRRKNGISKDILKTMAPFKSRFTLPIVLIRYTMLGGSIKEKYVALPTLGIDLSSEPEFRIEWKWGYRMVDTEVLKLMGWLKPHGDEMTQRCA